jgi:hypothetical protein
MSRKVDLVRIPPDPSVTSIHPSAQERSAEEVFGKPSKFQKVDEATVKKALGMFLAFLAHEEERTSCTTCTSHQQVTL